MNKNFVIPVFYFLHLIEKEREVIFDVSKRNNYLHDFHRILILRQII